MSMRGEGPSTSVRKGVELRMSGAFEALKADVMKVVEPIQKLTAPTPPADPNAPPVPPMHTSRKIQLVIGEASALLALPLQLANTGYAYVMGAFAAVYPCMPAAALGALYVGPAHAHTHPPSFTPPATPSPVPLPSLGPVLIGTSIRVLIHGLPAARCGDMGIAFTCGGFLPAFEITKGSSNVFIGGARAARLLDSCGACAPEASGARKALATVGLALGMAGAAVGADADADEAKDAKAAGNSAMASAKSLAASMAAAQLSLDVATMALKKMLGKDKAVIPVEGSLVSGIPVVLIGGYPVKNIPDPLGWAFDKLKARFGKKSGSANAGEGEAGPKVCAI